MGCVEVAHHLRLLSIVEAYTLQILYQRVYILLHVVGDAFNNIDDAALNSTALRRELFSSFFLLRTVRS